MLVIPESHSLTPTVCFQVMPSQRPAKKDPHEQSFGGRAQVQDARNLALVQASRGKCSCAKMTKGPHAQSQEPRVRSSRERDCAQRMMIPTSMRQALRLSGLGRTCQRLKEISWTKRSFVAKAATLGAGSPTLRLKSLVEQVIVAKVMMPRAKGLVRTAKVLNDQSFVKAKTNSQAQSPPLEEERLGNSHRKLAERTLNT